MIVNRSDAKFFYQFETNVTDSLGLNNGTVNGTSVYVDSISGKAFDFNGSTQSGYRQPIMAIAVFKRI